MPFPALEQAEIICDRTMEKAEEPGLAPMTVAVFDAGGARRVLKQPDPACARPAWCPTPVIRTGWKFRRLFLPSPNPTPQSVAFFAIF